MKNLDIREVIKRDEYRWLDEYKDRLCFISFGGSHAYGTNVPTSDIDIRGVMLPTKEELIGLKRFEQRIDEESDTTIYEFNKFIKLILNSNPNTIELLGCRPETVLIYNDIGLDIIQNVNKFISKKAIYSFGGYAVAQLRRLENALCHDAYSPEDKEKHILQTLEVIRDRNLVNNERFSDKIDVLIKDGNIHATIKEGGYDLRELNAALNEFNTVVKGYDKLNNRNKKKDELHLNKHAMHLTRLYLMLIDILEGKGVNTYREKDIPFLMKIRMGEYNLLDKSSEFWAKLNEMVNKVEQLKTITNLNDKPDIKWVGDFVMESNEKVVKEDVSYLREPMLLSENPDNSNNWQNS